MNALIMMYVYFDKSGEIKSISPDPNPAFEDSYNVVTVPLKDVESFMLGKKNPFDYFVKSVIRLGTTSCKITRKQALETSYLRSVDSFLTELPAFDRSSEANILIENFVNNKKLKISLNPVIKGLLEDGTDIEIEKLTTLIDTPLIYLFFTRKKDPYFLIKTISISPKDLFDKLIIHLDYTDDLSNVSVFTKKIIDGYGYVTR